MWTRLQCSSLSQGQAGVKKGVSELGTLPRTKVTTQRLPTITSHSAVVSPSGTAVPRPVRTATLGKSLRDGAALTQIGTGPHVNPAVLNADDLFFLYF